MRIKTKNFNFMQELNFKENLILTSVNSKYKSIFSGHLNLSLFFKMDNNFQHQPKEVMREDLLQHIEAIRNDWKKEIEPSQQNKFLFIKRGFIERLKKTPTQSEIDGIEEIFNFFEENPEGSEHMLYLFNFKEKKLIQDNLIKYYSKYADYRVKLFKETIEKNPIITKDVSKIMKLLDDFFNTRLDKDISLNNLAFQKRRLQDIISVFNIVEENSTVQNANFWKTIFFHNVKILDYFNMLEITYKPNEFLELKDNIDIISNKHMSFKNKLVKSEELIIKKEVEEKNHGMILYQKDDAFSMNSIFRVLKENAIDLDSALLTVKNLNLKEYCIEIDLKENRFSQNVLESFLKNIDNVVQEIEMSNESNNYLKKISFIDKAKEVLEQHIRLNILKEALIDNEEPERKRKKL